jgi:hypothetical protein
MNKKEQELFDLITKNEYIGIYKLGWVSENDFTVRVYHFGLSNFINKIIDLFGYGVFDNGGFNASVKENNCYIDLCEMLDGYANIENVFPEEQFKLKKLEMEEMKMYDLISRKTLIKDIREYADLKCCNGDIETANVILNSLSIIKNQPTAYDVDEVVEQIEADKEHTFHGCINKTHTIEIVKRGGKS